ncbi:MAG TPA: hypothetical protein VFV73_38840 [Streptosporangiaceae bacterium]|nr:hypothetical protein [Streptosporangiaceae bacterium]
MLEAICSRRPRKDVPLGVLRDRVLFETAYVCGARASEVCGMYVEDLALRPDDTSRTAARWSAWPASIAFRSGRCAAGWRPTARAARPRWPAASLGPGNPADAARFAAADPGPGAACATSCRWSRCTPADFCDFGRFHGLTLLGDRALTRRGGTTAGLDQDGGGDQA